MINLSNKTIVSLFTIPVVLVIAAFSLVIINSRTSNSTNPNNVPVTLLPISNSNPNQKVLGINTLKQTIGTINVSIINSSNQTSHYYKTKSILTFTPQVDTKINSYNIQLMFDKSKIQIQDMSLLLGSSSDFVNKNLTISQFNRSGTINFKVDNINGQSFTSNSNVSVASIEYGSLDLASSLNFSTFSSNTVTTVDNKGKSTIMTGN